MAQEYSSVEKIQTAFADIGAPLLRTLHQEGFIDDPAIKSLPISEVITPKQHDVGKEDGVIVVGVSTPKGPTARIQVVKNGEKYTSVLTLDVHTGDAHALVRNRESPAETSQVVTPNKTREVGTLCTAGSYCKLTVGSGGTFPCQSMDVECCLSQDNCTDIGELGKECTGGTCYQHCLFACGICEEGSC